MPIPESIRPIVDKPLWDQVQAILAENRVERATGSDAKHPSLLAGLVFDETGERLTPSHAVKKGTRYRYYVRRSLITGSSQGPFKRTADPGRQSRDPGDHQASSLSRRSRSDPRCHPRMNIADARLSRTG